MGQGWKGPWRFTGPVLLTSVCLPLWVYVYWDLAYDHIYVTMRKHLSFHSYTFKE